MSALPASGGIMGSRSGWIAVRDVETGERVELPPDTRCERGGALTVREVCSLDECAADSCVRILDVTAADGFWVGVVLERLP